MPSSMSAPASADAHLPTLLLADDDVFLQHVSRRFHPERPERVLAARQGVQASKLRGRVQLLPKYDAADEQITRVHGAEYVESLAAIRGKVGQLDPDTYYSERTFDAARRAAGAAIALVDELRARPQEHEKAYGFGIVRPPGHHARPGSAMGFCLVNSAAVAAAHALASGVDRVLILDWDVHHGNGTEEIFAGDPRVLYLSLHQSPYYPGTGSARTCGEGKGRGLTVNVPLSAGATDAVYALAFERCVVPVVQQFDPELVIVSAGYDAHELDPLAQMSLSDAAFGAMTSALLSALPRAGASRVMFLLEGGYDVDGVTGGVRATLDALAGEVFEASTSDVPAVFARQIDDVVRVQSQYWRL